MADRDHLETLQRGTEAWNLWRRKNRAVRPDLSHADLEGLNLRSANLNNVDLSYSNLEGVNLGRAYLEAAALHGATPRRAHLFGADLGHADLSENDLREAELWHARLEGANLRDARLTAADLRYADLTGADLRGCSLERANLTGVRLLRTDMRHCDLRGACLERTWIRDCRLENADFTDARIGLTAFCTVDLSATEGLASVLHQSASCIATDSLDLTAAGLRRDPARRQEVETFLRYAGVREVYLDLFRSLLDKPDAFSVFIRHSLADRTFARRLHSSLQSRGIRCWLNEHPMLPGDDFEESFDLRLHPSDRLLLCCSQASLTSWWLASELEHAARQAPQPGSENEILIPIDLDGFLTGGSWKSRHGPEIRSHLAADFAGWEDDEGTFEREIERLANLLD